MKEFDGIRPAFYARVSSEQQVRKETIDSQTRALRQRIAADGLVLDESFAFADDGVSGSVLVRPALEQLRDQAAAGGIDRLYVLCPDRLARSYAHQALLVDELRRAGVELVFLDHAHDPTPEGTLLLQVQGVIAEYERAKIQERNRRGMSHAARSGSVSVFGQAPFGYRYIDRREGGGVARFEIADDQAEVVRRIFTWVVDEGCSLAEIGRRLENQGVASPSGRTRWLTSTLASMLANPTYAGTAMFGRTRLGPRRETPRRPRRLKPGHLRKELSIYPTGASEQIAIAVPAIVEPGVFEAARARLAENRKRKRVGIVGATCLLQGLLVCSKCGYAYHGASSKPEKPHPYRYYRCGGSVPSRFGGVAICANKILNRGRIDSAVWEDLRNLLLDPSRLAAEHRRRLEGPAEPTDPKAMSATKKVAAVRRSIERLIDSYQDGYLEKEEFEPRIRGLRERLAQLEAAAAGLAKQERSEEEVKRVIGALEQFAAGVRERLDSIDFTTQRDLIRTLVDRIEVGEDTVRIVYKVNIVPFERGPSRGLLQHCPASLPPVRLDLTLARHGCRSARGVRLRRDLPDSPLVSCPGGSPNRVSKKSRDGDRRGALDRPQMRVRPGPQSCATRMGIAPNLRRNETSRDAFRRLGRRSVSLS
jgi:site-specific DNA recombinase